MLHFSLSKVRNVRSNGLNVHFIRYNFYLFRYCSVRSIRTQRVVNQSHCRCRIVRSIVKTRLTSLQRLRSLISRCTYIVCENRSEKKTRQCVYENARSATPPAIIVIIFYFYSSNINQYNMSAIITQKHFDAQKSSCDRQEHRSHRHRSF